jgi:hypothetical protein
MTATTAVSVAGFAARQSFENGASVFWTVVHTLHKELQVLGIMLLFA